MSKRVSWEEYFMSIAKIVATRATCDRLHVGAVVVKDRAVLSTGYNGSIRGLPHCDDIGHLMEDGHCVRTVHAEANAIAQAAKNGQFIDGGEMFVTALPCWHCFKLIANSGIERVVYDQVYGDGATVLDAARSLGIEVTLLSDFVQKA